jgi:succinoglycan biosynthesis transport protein ExoP
LHRRVMISPWGTSAAVALTNGGGHLMNAAFKIPNFEVAESAEQKLDLRTLINFVWRHWMLIAGVIVVALIVGLIQIVRATPLYTASTQVMLERDKTPGEIGSREYADGAAVEYQLAILQSDSLLRRAVIKENLASVPSAGDATDEDAKQKEEQAIQAAIGGLRGALSANRQGYTQVINISITWTDPNKAAQLANAVADALVVDQLDARFESAKRASGWLSDRIVELRRQLRSSEDAVADFRSAHGLIRTGPNVTLNDQQLADLNSKLLAARADAADKKSRVDFLAEVAAGKKSLDSLPAAFQSSAQSGMLSALRAKLADASQRQADLLARYNSRHPAVVTVEAEKRDIERSIAAESQRMVDAVRSDYTLAKAREAATEQAMREATGQGGLNSEDAIRLRELERTAAVNKSLFEDFLQKAKVTEEQSTFRPREARVIMPAQGAWQSYPNKNRMLMMALFIGVGLGIGGALAMEMLNVGFTTVRQIEELLEIPVLTSVAKMEDSKLQKGGVTFPVPFFQIHYPLSAFSESLRTLRSGILMTDVDAPPKVIHVTSSCPSEGKSTVAVSLAISAASSGKKVALIDADLRHPSVSKFFKMEEKKGLVDLLTGAAKLTDVLMLKGEQLAILGAGSKSLNPPDLLGSERMKALVEQLKENFDYVLIDTPPVGPVIDAVIVAGMVDKTIFVVRWASTARELVQTSVQKLSVQKRVGGIVLNMVVANRAKKYGYGSDAYGGREYAKYYSEA